MESKNVYEQLRSTVDEQLPKKERDFTLLAISAAEDIANSFRRIAEALERLAARP